MTHPTEVLDLSNELVEHDKHPDQTAVLVEFPAKHVNANPGPEAKAIHIGNEVKPAVEAALKDALRAKRPLNRYRILIVVD